MSSTLPEGLASDFCPVVAPKAFGANPAPHPRSALGIPHSPLFSAFLIRLFSAIRTPRLTCAAGRTSRGESAGSAFPSASSFLASRFVFPHGSLGSAGVYRRGGQSEVRTPSFLLASCPPPPWTGSAVASFPDSFFLRCRLRSRFFLIRPQTS